MTAGGAPPMRSVSASAVKAMLADGGERALIDVREELIFRTDHAGSAPPTRSYDLFAPVTAAEAKPGAARSYVGGHIYDRGIDGSECRWATVLAYEPPNRIVFSWNISAEWKLESDPAKASEVEVRFDPEGPERTRVELEHRNLDRHGTGWEDMRDAVGSPDGWPDGLTRYADYTSG